jgi:NADPH:quinone reductase-like Zn-dependent oxidoreductase
MKAIAVEEVGGPEQLKLLELPVPKPGPGEVQVRIEAAGVNSVDAMFREGYLDSGARPLVMGSDFSGVIERLGDGVEDMHAGDEVYGYKLLGNGTYAEFAAVPADYLALKPETVSHVEAAALPCVALTAYQALVDVLDVQPGETVAITAAAGGVGSVAIQLAAHRGSHVLAIAGARNEDYVRSLGAEEFIDYRGGDWTQAVTELFPGGVDVVLSCWGGEMKRRSPQILRDGGRMAWMTGDDQAGPPMERMIAGAYSGGIPRRDTLEAIAGLIDAGALRASVEQVYPLEDAASAQQRAAEGHVRGKLVIDVGHGQHLDRDSVSVAGGLTRLN